MYRIDIQVRPQLPIISVLGAPNTPETETVWDETPVLMACDSHQISVGIDHIQPGDDYPITLYICDTTPEVAEEFFAAELTLDTNGIEVGEVIAATQPGEPSAVGMRFTVPWQGRTWLQFAAPNGFKKATGGIQVPTSIDIYLSALG